MKSETQASAVMPKFRHNVAAILINSQGEVLVCERANNASAWQFPQGGVDKGEADIEALYREVEEEVGISNEHYDVIGVKGAYKYFYPPKVRAKKKWDGQKQTYFLCQMKAGAPDVDLGEKNAEFRDYDWVQPKEFDAAWLPEFKLEVYQEVMRDFFGVEISPAPAGS